jgi:hypothetical protein
MTATLVRADVHPAGLLTSSQGNAQVLRGGHVLVGWGAAGYVTEFDGDGRVVFDAHLPAEVDTYRAYRFRWTGRPSTRPAIAVRRKDLDEAYVYASWNGATEVARWLVLAGDDAAHLHRVAGAARDGFETRVTVARGPRFFAVRAFDRAGRALGTSAAVSLRRL